MEWRLDVVTGRWVETRRPPVPPGETATPLFDNGEIEAVDRQEKKRLQGLQQALRLTCRHSGVDSEQAWAIRKDLDDSWAAIRTTMEPDAQLESLTAEIERMQLRAETVSTRLQELVKETAEAEAELQILARRSLMFKQQKELVTKKLEDRKQPAISATAAQNEELARTSQQLSSV